MKKLYFLFIIFFIRIYSKIKENPIFLTKGGYPIVLFTEDDYYYVLTELEDIKIEKKSGKIVDKNNTILTSSNSIFIGNISNSNYLINESNKCLEIISNPFISFKSFPIESLNSTDSIIVKRVGSIQQNNDFIIYGYYRNLLIFASKSQSYFYSTFIDAGINDNITCKFIEGEYFICAIFINNNALIYLLYYHINDKEIDKNSLNSILVYTFDECNGIILYDTPKGNIKLFCINLYEVIDCKFIHLSNFTNNKNITFDLVSNIRI